MALAMYQWGFYYREVLARFNGLLDEELRYASPSPTDLADGRALRLALTTRSRVTVYADRADSEEDPETWPEPFELWSNQVSAPAISVEKTWKTFFNETVGLYNFPELVEHFALLSLSDDPAAEAELLATWGVNHDEGTYVQRSRFDACP